MKIIRCFIVLLALIIIGKLSYSQTTIYSQSFGSPQLPLSGFPAGWSTTGLTNGWALSSSTPSTGAYTGASGGYNVRVGYQTATLNFSSVSTVGYNNISIIWGAIKPTNPSTYPTFQWSSDSITWNTVNYANALVANTWELINGGISISLPTGAAGVSALRLRWTYVVTVSSLNPYRIDDILIQGTPTVSNSPSKLAILSINYGLNPDSCHSFDVVVQSQDVNGNPANVFIPQLVILSKFTGNGTGVLTGGTGTIQSNTNIDTITVNFSRAETGVSLLASGPSLSSDTSNLFNVLPCLPIVPGSLPTCYEWQHTTGNALDPLPTGWYNYGLDSSILTGYAVPYSGVFDNQSDSLLIYFNSPPDSLVCWLRTKNLSGNFLFEIKESGLNHVYSNIASFSMTSIALGPTWSHHVFSLNSTTRYVKFAYTTMVLGDILIDSVCVYPYVAPLPATKLKITSINGGLNPDSCSVFNIVVQSHDINNNPVNVLSDTKVCISVNTGNSTSLGGNFTDTIHSGTNTLTLPVTYNSVQSGVSLIVSRIFGDVLSSDTSLVFNVNQCFTNIKSNTADKNIFVYPNPSNDILNIENIEDIRNIKITNIFGQDIKIINNLNVNKTEFSVKSLTEGIYVIIFEKRNGEIRKVVIAKQ